MGRWLIRLLLLGLILFAVSRVVSRVLNSDEDFDDFDDLEDGLAFTETPVEIDVPATEAVTSTASTLAVSAAAEAGAEASFEGAVAELPSTEAASDTGGPGASMGTDGTSTDGSGRSVIDVNGIGPTYAARLQEVGINTMSDLAGADVDELAGQIEVIGGRTEIEDWIKQAKEFTSGGATGAE